MGIVSYSPFFGGHPVEQELGNKIHLNFSKIYPVKPVNSIEHRLQSLKTSVIQLLSAGELRPVTEILVDDRN